MIHDPAILKFRITDFATIIFQKMQKRWQSLFFLIMPYFLYGRLFLLPRVFCIKIRGYSKPRSGGGGLATKGNCH